MERTGKATMHDLPPDWRKADMPFGKNRADRRRLALQLSRIALLVLAGMTIFQLLKHAIAPNITLWESHLVTIVFSTVCAVVASFRVLRRHIALNRELTERDAASARLQKNLEHTVEKLTVVLSHVKNLSGMLPICSSCKKIRDGKGHWNPIEAYIRERSDAQFSHGICPECAQKLYPEIYTKEMNPPPAAPPNGH